MCVSGFTWQSCIVTALCTNKINNYFVHEIFTLKLPKCFFQWLSVNFGQRGEQMLLSILLQRQITLSLVLTQTSVKMKRHIFHKAEINTICLKSKLNQFPLRHISASKTSSTFLQYFRIYITCDTISSFRTSPILQPHMTSDIFIYFPDFE